MTKFSKVFKIAVGAFGMSLGFTIILIVAVLVLGGPDTLSEMMSKYISYIFWSAFCVFVPIVNKKMW